MIVSLLYSAKGKRLDATQELLAVGAGNIMGSFVRSMPVAGSFTRTAVNNASGVRTTLGGIVTGVMMLLSLAFLTGTFYYIPKSTLAAIIICAMMYLFDYEAIVLLWKTKSELIDLFMCGKHKSDKYLWLSNIISYVTLSAMLYVNSFLIGGIQLLFSKTTLIAQQLRFFCAMRMTVLFQL